MQRFKPKRRLKKLALLKLFLLLLLLFLLFKFIGLLIINFPNSKLLQLMINDNNYQFIDKTNQNIFIKVYEYAKDSIINKPNTMLVSSVSFNKNDNNNHIAINNINSNVTQNDNNSSDIKVKEDNNVLVYIYSSHQKEGYNNEYTEDYNINPNVFLASQIMQSQLIDSGINTVVMKDDITAYLNNNDLDYSYSYVASRYYLKQAINNYPTVKLFIDFHRDAASKEATTTIIDNKNYAKVMFVVGKEYDTYQENLEVANKINDKIKKLYPSLSRGVLQKEGKGANGVYNQDLSSNIILLEIGGDKNNINEVINTIELLVPIIGDYINEA